MSTRMQALMIANGALVLLMGMLGGFGLAFFLLGEIALWPIPLSLEVQLPGTERGWRAMHLGNITNGTMLLAIAAVAPRLPLGATAEKWVGWGLVGTVWGNAIFYLMAAAFTDGRALTLGANRFGGGDLGGAIGFFGAYVAVFLVIAALVIVARSAFAAAAASK